MKIFNDFTFERTIQFIILAAVIVLMLGVLLGYLKSTDTGTDISFGVNGMTEMRCINNYQFIVSEGGQARQVIDESGKGLRCKGEK